MGNAPVAWSLILGRRMEFIITLIAGAVGGMFAGGMLRTIGLGLSGDAGAGILGGALGWQVLKMLETGGLRGAMGGGDAEAIIAALVSGALGGAAVTAALATIRNLLRR